MHEAAGAGRPPGSAAHSPASSAATSTTHSAPNQAQPAAPTPRPGRPAGPAAKQLPDATTHPPVLRPARRRAPRQRFAFIHGGPDPGRSAAGEEQPQVARWRTDLAECRGQDDGRHVGDSRGDCLDAASRARPGGSARASWTSRRSRSPGRVRNRSSARIGRSAAKAPSTRLAKVFILSRPSSSRMTGWPSRLAQHRATSRARRPSKVVPRSTANASAATRIAGRRTRTGAGSPRSASRPGRAAACPRRATPAAARSSRASTVRRIARASDWRRTGGVRRPGSAPISDIEQAQRIGRGLDEFVDQRGMVRHQHGRAPPRGSPGPGSTSGSHGRVGVGQEHREVGTIDDRQRAFGGRESSAAVARTAVVRRQR